jgi:hypothetical protein
MKYAGLIKNKISGSPFSRHPGCLLAYQLADAGGGATDTKSLIGWGKS